METSDPNLLSLVVQIRLPEQALSASPDQKDPLGCAVQQVPVTGATVGLLTRGRAACCVCDKGGDRKEKPTWKTNKVRL